MRLPLAIAALAAVLLARADAHAATGLGVEPGAAPLGRIVVERCSEAPMSLALQIAEAEAARSLSPRSLTSDAEPIVATPAPRRVVAPSTAPTPKPFSPTPHACTSPGEPGCEVSAPFHAPEQIEFARSAHVAVLLPTVPALSPPAAVEIVMPTWHLSGAPTDAHAPPPWRPPAR